MISPTAPLLGLTPTQRDTALQNAARSLEVNFLTEMLTSARLGKTSKNFGGGAGEELGELVARAESWFTNARAAAGTCWERE